MRSRSRDEIPAEIERARIRFERWRKNRKKVTRIPDRLWTAAVDAARLHGVNLTATALRDLDKTAPGVSDLDFSFIQLNHQPAA